jgi:hypothetical protein
MRNDLERTRKEAVYPNLIYYPSICLEGLRKIMKNVTQYSRPQSRDLSSGPPQYEAGMLAANR